MNAFNRLPGFTPSPPGLEHRIWRRLLAEYEHPPLDESIDDALTDYVERRQS